MFAGLRMQNGLQVPSSGSRVGLNSFLADLCSLDSSLTENSGLRVDSDLIVLGSSTRRSSWLRSGSSKGSGLWLQRGSELQAQDLPGSRESCRLLALTAVVPEFWALAVE